MNLVKKIIFLFLFFLFLNPIKVLAQNIPPGLAVETMHFNQLGAVRNVNGFYETDKKLFIPAVFNNYYGYIHAVSILNTEPRSGTVNVRYFQTNGGEVANKTFTIPSRGFLTVVSSNMGGLPDNFAGSAVIESSMEIVAEVAISNQRNNRDRSYRAIPEKKLSTTLYSPIAYDRIFRSISWANGGYYSYINIQNAGSQVISQGALIIKLFCRDGKNYNLTNSTDIPPNTSQFINIRLPDGAYSGVGFCADSQEIDSVFFGHAELNSPQPIAATLTVANFGTNSQREEELDSLLSTMSYVPSILFGNWRGVKAGGSLNISNPNNQAADVTVDLYRKVNGYFQFEATRRPQAPGNNGCNYFSTEPIPAYGERSLFFCGPVWGDDESAFGFGIIKSNVPVITSYNKATNLDDFSELAISATELKSTVYVPQVFVNFLPQLGNYNTRVNVLNPSDTDFNYKFTYFNSNGEVVAVDVILITGKTVAIADTSSLSSGQAYSLVITPVVDILSLRSLLQNFISIFDYNNLVGDYGR